MYFSVCPIVQSGACANKREPITSAESEFPKESIVCRTVTRGSLPEEASLTAATNHQNKSFNSPTDIGNETVINRNFVHKTEEITRHQKSHISLKHLHWPARRGSLSSTKSSLLNTNKSIPNTVNMINSRLADLLLSRLSMSNSSNHSCVHQSTTKSPARPVKDYHHHPTGQWSLGMILISVIILSSFSTTSVVMCASLGHDDGGGGEHGSALATGSPRLAGGLMTSNSKLLQHPREVDELKESSFSVHNRGQIHHPPSSVSSAPASPEGSLGRGRRATEDREENSHLLPTNYHLERFHHQQPEEINPFLRSPPIQKVGELENYFIFHAFLLFRLTCCKIGFIHCFLSIMLSFLAKHHFDIFHCCCVPVKKAELV